MKILHTISSLNTKSGGTSTCTYGLAKALNSAGCSTDILTIRPRDSSCCMIGEDSFIRAVENDECTPLGISLNIRNALKNNEYDLYHTHGLWSDTNHMTATFARKKNIPYVISPHGMLYPQALARGSWKKQLMMFLGHKKDIASADCIHVTCTQEMEYVRRLGFRNPVVVVPNPILIPDYISSIQRSVENSFRIGFLGRLHPIKRVHDLIFAWARLGNKSSYGELLIVGSGDKAYVNYLHDIVKRLDLHNVRFVDFLSGQEKYRLIASLTALFLPSESENFGMVIPEALIMGIPVMASFNTPWEELKKYNCGWWCDNDVATIANCMEELLTLSDEELRCMGERGKKLIYNKYTPEIIASKMEMVYDYCLNLNNKPDFLF